MKADLHFSKIERTDAFKAQFITTRGQKFLADLYTIPFFPEQLQGSVIPDVEEARFVYSDATSAGLKISFETAEVRDALYPKLVR